MKKLSGKLQVSSALAEKAQEFQAMPVISDILNRLSNELPTELTFHSCEHTKDVMLETLFFAEQEGCSSRELELLAIAAAYHDAGFLLGAKRHEERGADMAEAAMRLAADYSEEEIRLVHTMVMDTRFVPESDGPMRRTSTRLSAYLLDADMSNFGREDFFDRLDAYCEETNVQRCDYQESMLNLMERHRWFTEVAKQLREEMKQANLAKLANGIT